jgi:hypothetical protein
VVFVPDLFYWDRSPGLAALMKPSMVRVQLEAAIAVFAGVPGILTPVWRDGIEALSGWDPDHHTGSVE